MNAPNSHFATKGRQRHSVADFCIAGEYSTRDDEPRA